MLLAVASASCLRAAEAALDSYSAAVAKTYSYRFGKDNPFWPSNIQTGSGGFIDPKSFPTAQYCGHCHQAIYAQWRQSAHSNSERPPWYLRNVNLLNTEKGIEFSRHCEGCHDPVAVVAGAIAPGAPEKRPYDEDGVSCSVCHAIQKVDTRGTGSFTLGTPAVVVDSTGEPVQGMVSDAAILSHLDRHRQAVMKDLYRSSEFCAACHKAALPKSLNDYKWQRAISLYDEWQDSGFAKESPLAFYRKDMVSTCQSCHMPRETASTQDYAARGGAVYSHRWVGANTMVPRYYGFSEQYRKVVTFLQNSVFDIDIFGLELNTDSDVNSAKYAIGGRIVAPIGTTPFEVQPGERLTVTVVIENKGIAHSHVPEQRDMYESWVDFVVRNARGKKLAESGGLSQDGTLDESAHAFTNRLINSKGQLNGLHEVWNNRIIPYNNTIQPGRSQLVRYSFRMPQNAREAVTVTATVKYRRFDQHFIDFGMHAGYTQPVVEMASATRTFLTGVNRPQAYSRPDDRTWVRWNNYGIALLEAQQAGESVKAFQRVIALHPDYADGYTNAAIGEIEWGKYEEALPYLLEAEALEPGDARPRFYLALVKRSEGDVEGAIGDLQQIREQFPRSRDVRRELGICYYQQKKYDLARAEYEAVQRIDPDDLSAHYNLSLIYRELGMREKSAEEARLYAEQKSDPSANKYAISYLRDHPEVVRETVPWHVHNLEAGRESARH
ncbi:MAG: tetratricopeptide repeat protein [Acidobacteriaceae bacterium]|nr:tetratricopeptide repeat protein [Acidobacteriaceae bacterium]